MLLLLACLVLNSPQAVTKEIHVQNAQPTEILRMLEGPNMPAGLEYVRPYNRGMVLEARGTAEGIKVLEERTNLLDIRHRNLRVEIALKRISIAPNGKLDEEALYSVAIETPNNRLAIVGIVDDSARPAPLNLGSLGITPRINGDDSISTFVDFQNLRAANGKQVSLNRRFRAGEAFLIPLAEIESAAARDRGSIAMRDVNAEPTPGLYLDIRLLPIQRR